MLTQYDFACCNLEVDPILTHFDYKSYNPISTMVMVSWFVYKDKINIKYGTRHWILRIHMKLLNTPEPMVMNIPDSMNRINDIELHNELNYIAIETLMDKSDNEYSENDSHQYKSSDTNTSTKNMHEK